MDEARGDRSRLTSTGLIGSDADWLDTHFALASPEYEAQVRAVGIRPGWRVLDAGCGAGGFLPWLADLVGPAGAITALDLTPENVATVERRVAAQTPPCPVEVVQGDVTALPYPDDSFDAVWCANTSQYLDDDRLHVALAEFRRVVRPGGLVAVKEGTGPGPVHPLPPFLQPRLWVAASALDGPLGQALQRSVARAPVLRRWLERAGLEDVWQRRTPIERWAPFTPVERQVVLAALDLFATMAARCDLPAEDRAAWARARDPSSPAHPANADDGYLHEGNVLAVGRVP